MAPRARLADRDGVPAFRALTGVGSCSQRVGHQLGRVMSLCPVRPWLRPFRILILVPRGRCARTRADNSTIGAAR